LLDYLTTIPYEEESGDMDTVMKGTKANETQLTVSGSGDTVNARVTETAPSMSSFPPDKACLPRGKDQDAVVEIKVRSRLLFKVNVILLLLVAWQVRQKCKKKAAATATVAPATMATASNIMLATMQVASRWMLFISIMYWAWLHLCLVIQQQSNNQREHDRVYDQNS
jgi:hypothetical protein